MYNHSSSPEQIAANRANAQLSTGPRTEFGKASASRNRTTYGFTGGGFFLLPQEDPTEYYDLLDSLRAEHEPATETEDLLVIKLAQHHLLQQRALYFQTLALDQTTLGARERELNLYLRYQAQHERSFSKALAQLEHEQNKRRDEEHELYELKAAVLVSRRDKAKADADIAEEKADGARERLQTRQAARASVLTATASMGYQEIGFESQNAKHTPIQSVERLETNSEDGQLAAA